MKYLALLLTFFLFSLTVFAQVDKDDEFVSTIELISAPVDSLFLIEFETDDRIKHIKYAKSVYYKPRDFLIVSWSDNVLDVLDELPHYDLRGYPVITTIKKQ